MQPNLKNSNTLDLLKAIVNWQKLMIAITLKINECYPEFILWFSMNSAELSFVQW